MSVNSSEYLDTLEMIPLVWEILTAMLVLVEEARVFSFTFISFLSA